MDTSGQVGGPEVVPPRLTALLSSDLRGMEAPQWVLGPGWDRGWEDNAGGDPMQEWP